MIAFQRKHTLEPTGIADAKTAAEINRRFAAALSFIVRGTVPYMDRKPFARGIVRVFEKDLCEELLLGEAINDRRGRDEVKYNAAQFHRPEKESADLI